MESLIINALAAKETPTVESMSAIVSDYIINEEDISRLVELQEFMGVPTPSPLVEAVLEADPEAFASWKSMLAKKYEEEYIAPLVTSLEASDVCQMELGDGDDSLTIYLVGGMTSGSSPSASFDLWLDIFNRDENPYSDITFNAGFIALRPPFVPSMEIDAAYISGVAVTQQDKVAPPF